VTSKISRRIPKQIFDPAPRKAIHKLISFKAESQKVSESNGSTNYIASYDSPTKVCTFWIAKQACASELLLILQGAILNRACGLYDVPETVLQIKYEAEIYALPGSYLANSDDSLPTIWDNLSVPS